MTLEEARALIGQPVFYSGGSGDSEPGVITGVGEIYVFVRFGGAPTSKATRAEDLYEDEGEPDLDALTPEDWAALRGDR